MEKKQKAVFKVRTTDRFMEFPKTSCFALSLEVQYPARGNVFNCRPALPWSCDSNSSLPKQKEISPSRPTPPGKALIHSRRALEIGCGRSDSPVRTWTGDATHRLASEAGARNYLHCVRGLPASFHS